MNLFSPVGLGAVTARNRVMQLATGNNLHADGKVTDRMVDFYVARANGGIGSIVTGALATHPSDRPNGLRAYDIDGAPGFKRLATAVHDAGAILIGQLNHRGRQHHVIPVPALVAPSSLACPHSGGTPHALDVEEIRSIVESFALCAANLQDAGFDGVEIHGGQGHLIQQFLSPFSNARDDEYGGSLENRLRFLSEILEAVRRRCGTQFVVGLRLGVEEFVPDGLHLSEAKLIARQTTSGSHVDYISVTQSNFANLDKHSPDRTFPRTPFVDFAAEIKEAVSRVPVVGGGRVLDPETAQRILDEGKADIIGLSRPLLADANWAKKAASGRSSEIRQCVSCNQCWGWTIAGQSIGCIHNAATGREREARLLTIARKKRVLVVGGGPAGLEAARIAGLRGHLVTLHEATDRLGGAVVVAATAPGDSEIMAVVDYLRGAVERAGVEVHLSSRVGLDTIRQDSPDAVVVATGATDSAWRIGFDPTVPVHTGRVALGLGLDTAREVIVLDEDGYYETCAVARRLATSGAKVHIVTRFFELGREIPAVSRMTAIAALDALGVRISTTTWPTNGADGRMLLRHELSGRTWEPGPVDGIVVVGRRIADDAIYHDAKEIVAECYRIGDALMPKGRIADAIRQGNSIGLRL